VLKIIHYAILLYYFSGTSYPDDKPENVPTPAEFIDYD